MQWQGARQSINVEDRRMGGRVALGGGLGSIVIIILAVLFGADPRALLQQVNSSSTSDNSGYVVPGESGEGKPLQDEAGQFAATVLADTEDVWHKLFHQMGKEYTEPKLVLFRGYTQSNCGLADAAVGPFYCPGDQKVYVDLTFFDELSRRFKAPGDFAQAYVIAHEVGHHVQQLLGISDKVQAQRRRASPRESNDLSVRLELQADFLAGVWAYHAHKMRHMIQDGDVEEALRAASAIGDDRLQRRAQGYVVPDSFTHGTSEQRVRWFRKGLETGDIAQGDTFAVREP